MKATLAFLALSVLAACAADVGTAPKRLFYVSFDQWDTKADQAGGSPKSDFKDSLMLRQPEGAYSRAGMRIEPGETLNYPAKGNFDSRRGTVSFWVKPFRWQKAHLTKRIMFFNLHLKDIGVHFMIGRMEDTMLKFGIGIEDPPNPGWKGTRAVARVPDWAAGDKPEWHRIDATWDTVDDMELALYVDGKLENRVVMNIPVPPSSDGLLSFIALNDWAGCPFNNLDTTTLIDEIEIWDRPLTGTEIAKAYTRRSGASLGGYRPDDAVKPPIKVEFIPLYEPRAFLYKLSLNNLPEPWPALIEKGSAKLHAELAMPGEGSPVAQDLSVTNRNLEVRLPVKNRWPAGDYRLTLKLADPSAAKPFVHTNVVTKPDTPWLGSSIGLDPQIVPSPWTPLKISTPAGEKTDRAPLTVSPWGRTYTLAGAFPSSVVSQGKELLAAPIRLVLRTPAGENQIGPGSLECTTKQPARVEFKGEGKAGDLTVSYDLSVDFDGFLLVKLRIQPPAQGIDVQALTLEIPLKNEFATMLRNPRQFVDLQKIWDGKSPYRARYEPYHWLGSEAGGLCVMTESDKNWNYEPGATPCQVILSSVATSIRYEMVSKPGRVTRPLEYTIGFEATPVKPLRKGWRRLRPTAGPLAEDPCANATTIGYDFSFEYISWFVPQEWPRDEWQERTFGFANLDVKLKVLNGLGMKAFPYTSGTVIADNNPVWDFFVGAWQNEKGPVSRGSTGGGYTTRRDGKKFNMTAADTKSWSPFLAYMADQLLSNPKYKWGLGGIYVDNTHPYAGDNPYSGNGYENDAFGRSGVSYMMFGMRDLAMRLLRVIRKDLGDDGILWLHAHNNFIAPIHGLGDYFYPGEQYGYLVPGKRFFFMDNLPIDVFKEEMNASVYGVPQVLIHCLHAIEGTPPIGHVYHISFDQAVSEHVIAMSALHDTLFALGLLNPESLREFYRIVDKTGMVEAEFLPYWRPNGIRVLAEGVKVSVYRTPSQIMAVLVNFTDKDRDVSFETDRAFFGWKNPTSGYDERRVWPVDVKDGRLTVPVKAKSYTIVTVREGDGK